MNIDLTGWNEYVADDVPPGAIPCGVELEMLNIQTADAFKEPAIHDIPSGLIMLSTTFKSRLFWRLKNDQQ